MFSPPAPLSPAGAAGVRERVHLSVRRLGLDTLIGFDALNSVDVAGTAKRRAFVAGCMRRIEAEHRRWSGTDARDPLLIHIAELDLTDHRLPGPDAVADLRGFGQPLDHRDVVPLVAQRPREFVDDHPNGGRVAGRRRRAQRA